MKQGCTKKPVGDICKILNGFAFKSNEYVDDGIRVLRITNVQKGYIVDDDPQFFPIIREKEISKYMLYEGDLLMSLTGNVGRVGVLSEEFLPAALNQRVACLRIKESARVNLKYLFHIFNSKTFEDDCIVNATGIAQKNMSTKWLENYLIPVPPIAEQEKIVAELDCLSGIIEKKKQQLKELDNLAQSIFYEMFGNPLRNERGWGLKRIADVCVVNPPKKVTAQGLGNKDVVSFLPMEDLPIKACYHHPDKTRLYEEVQSSYTCFANDDVLMAKVTPCFENGKLGIVTNLHNGVGYGSSEFIVIRANNVDVLKEYIYFVTMDSLFIEKACAQLTGTSGLRRVPRQYVENCNITLPPLTLQQQFASKIESIEKQKELIAQSIKETETLFNSRMDYYFN